MDETGPNARPVNRARGPGESTTFATAIVGAGPGGTGPLVYAAQAGLLDRWLSMGVVVIDRAQSFGGAIGRYVVNSDTLGRVYLECLDAPAAYKTFARLRSDPVAKDIEAQSLGFPPLPLVGEYFDRFGRALEDALAKNRNSAFLGRTSITALRLRPDGSLTLVASDSRRAIHARTAVLALGGRPVRVPTVIEGLKPARTLTSDALLTSSGLVKAKAILESARKPTVLILGGAHSAYSSAWALLNLLPSTSFAEGAITIACRRPPKIYYPTRAEAWADNYPFTEDDICPRTQRVNRLAGLRGDGRELWRRMSSRPGTAFEARVRTLRAAFDKPDPELLRRARNADLVVTAFGYASRTIPVFDATGRRLALQADSGGPAVDDEARILLHDGSTLPNVFGIGLGSGFRPHSAMGGEPSFRGQANSLWLYQNDIGGKVYGGVQAYLQSERDMASSVQLLAAGAR